MSHFTDLHASLHRSHAGLLHTIPVLVHALPKRAPVLFFMSYVFLLFTFFLAVGSCPCWLVWALVNVGRRPSLHELQTSFLSWPLFFQPCLQCFFPQQMISLRSHLLKFFSYESEHQGFWRRAQFGGDVKAGRGPKAGPQAERMAWERDDEGRMGHSGWKGDRAESGRHGDDSAFSGWADGW